MTLPTVHMLSQQETELARKWLADCSWPNLDPAATADLTNQSVWSGVQRHYPGGIDQFLSDIQEVRTTPTAVASTSTPASVR